MSALQAITDELAAAVDRLSFPPPAAFVYNPLDYAREPHRAYLARWADGPKEVVFLGMNPGPFGMVQTGVPFGEVSMVRAWLGIDEPVGVPARVHPKRPVEGFACRRSEVSGRRLWGWAAQRFGTPERFFARFVVANYCPLAFLEAGGKNVTPDKLPTAATVPLYAACDRALARAAAEVWRPRLVVGVGAFAEARARTALAGTGIAFGRILHPSPASPAANRGWAEQAEAELAALGVEVG